MGRYYVQTSDGLIVGAPTAPTLDTPPTGATTQVIPDTVGARTGGTWIDPLYTPPAGQPVPYDPDTELGRRQIASTTLHEYLKSVTLGVHAVRHEKPQADVEKAEQFIAMAHWATYVAAHMGMLIDNFETWVELMVMGPQHATTTQDIFQSVHSLQEDVIPTQACAWVSPIDQVEVTGLDMAREKSTAGTPAIATSATLGWFQGEVVDLTDVYLGDGDWIRSLTA